MKFLTPVQDLNVLLFHKSTGEKVCNNFMVLSEILYYDFERQTLEYPYEEYRERIEEKIASY